MGNILGVPVTYALKTPLTHEDGFRAGVREVVAHSYLERTYKKTKRLDLYNIESADISNLESLNYRIPYQEEVLEHCRELRYEGQTDSIFFCGFNSKDEKLVVKISRNKDGLASVWLHLRLSDGKTYKLPEEKLFRSPMRTGPETFAAGGLRLRCLQPMRKWRISFSGLLLEKEDGFEETKMVHAKFSFCWTASSFLYDLTSDIPTKTFASYLSKEKWKAYVPNISGLSGQFDRYVQSGNMVGTYQIDGEEKEMYLWGSRKRSLDLIPQDKSYSETEYYAYLEEGEMLYFGRLGSSDTKLQHGCIVQSNFLGGSVDYCNISEDTKAPEINFRKDKFEWTATFKESEQNLELGDFSGNCSNLLSLRNVILNDQKGHGLIVTTEWHSQRTVLPSPKCFLSNLDPSATLMSAQLLSLKQPSCRDTNLTGGKGSSLADLTLLSAMEGTFSVPKGVVVTTRAYKEFLKESCLEKFISQLELAAWKPIPVDLVKECQRVSAEVGKAPLPASVKGAIRSYLSREFGEDLDRTRLAVRSSASGEDSEEMSAAGQMKTFLGVKGLEQVYDAVVKCWASQFEYIAIQYKRQNGQLLNSPMAVVIQEMVPAEVAGVMFTCDPVTGNPARITITANYGIGESVVSASADPDTIIVTRDEKGETKVDSIEVGGKGSMVIMTDTGVTEELLSEDFTSQCSLSPKLAKVLADLGVLIEEAYGCIVDIEWAVKNNHIYLLQARPVTTFDKETNMEIMHEGDSPHRCENEWISTANLGEVFPGAMTYLGMTSFAKGFEMVILTVWLRRMKTAFPWSPYYTSGMTTYRNHFVFSILRTMLRYYHGKHTIMTLTQNLAFFGRVLDDPEMLRLAQRTNSYFPDVSAPRQALYLIQDVVCASSRLKRRRKTFPVGSRLELPMRYSAAELNVEIAKQWFSLQEPMRSHFECSFFSSIATTAMLSGLIDMKAGVTSEALSDVGYILSNCAEVESVEVPNAIESLARMIMAASEATGFDKMDTRDALMWLERTELPIGQEFSLLLKKHGHRGFKEFDMYSNPWGSDPIPLVRSLQEIVSKGKLVERKRAPLSTEETMKNLKLPLNWRQRLLLKVAIPFCRKAVALREGSKSLLISVVDCMRQSYRRLGAQMVAEGRLPEADLIYFLLHFEVDELIRTRSPKLVQKAIRRKALYPAMDKMVFPEIYRGMPKAINYDKKPEFREATFQIKGVPVSQGTATGFARVATTLEEAREIRSGEILIAYSTDIGWSPYFPLLGGVATELGGLVSHGAVVAREYGLPCVVGVHGATLQFNTGDKVFIDGTRGILCKLED